jgi:rare lipoprotein A
MPALLAPFTRPRLLPVFIRLRGLSVGAIGKYVEVSMARSPCWCMLLVACHILVLSTALVEAHSQVPLHAQVGWASWYGPGFHGRQTASGEQFSMHELTAAHRALPLGTKVLVQNLETDAQVEVKITDRGPYVDPQHRIIDLSRAAADRLGLAEQGVGPVRVVVSEEALARQDTVVYEVQVGAFLESEQAYEILEQLGGRYPTAYVTTREGPIGRYYRIRMGPFATQPLAQHFARVLQREGYAVFVDAVAASSLPVRRLDPPGEERLQALEVVGGSKAHAAGRSPLSIGHMLIGVMAMMVMAVASYLLSWTRAILTSTRGRHALFADVRPAL